ncbi:MAG: SOS response-associated peptidase [Papillibacter sp.]|nr:SOS response-associated peptidase [Papillibacter sp.]
MCGRYQAAWDIERPELEKIGEIIRNKYPEEELKYGEIYPADRAPVLIYKSKAQDPIVSDRAPVLTGEAAAASDKAEVCLMRWGFKLSDKTIINARSETAAQKPLFKKSLMLRRCVIITTGFYEWSHNPEDKKDKKKFLFRLPDTPVLYLAGFYEFRDGEERYIIMTTRANASVSDIHDRMPVIVARSEIIPWLRDTDYSQRVLARTGPELIRSET